LRTVIIKMKKALVMVQVDLLVLIWLRN